MLRVLFWFGDTESAVNAHTLMCFMPDAYGTPIRQEYGSLECLCHDHDCVRQFAKSLEEVAGLIVQSAWAFDHDFNHYRTRLI